jgi:DNA-directed RNA polymerase II subunit RPB2
MQELQVMNIQMRIITEDNIDQLTSMNYSKTIENIKLTQLTAKESSEFAKRYEKPLLYQPISTENIVKEPIKLKDNETKDEDSYEENDEDDDSDESSIDPVSLKATAAAEEAYQNYLAAEAIDDEEFSNPPISVDTSDSPQPELDDVETISVSPNTQEAAVQEKSEPKLEVITDSLIQQNLEPDKSIEINDEDNSAKRKTIKFEGQ